MVFGIIGGLDSRRQPYRANRLWLPKAEGKVCPAKIDLAPTSNCPSVETQPHS